jgi:RNA polymerase sigma-70 factor (ECF subfamily)
MRTAPDPPGAADRRQRLTQLFQRYGDDIHAYAAHRLGPDQAADVVGEVFLAAWRRLDTIRSGHERPWLFGAARSCANWPSPIGRYC